MALALSVGLVALGPGARATTLRPVVIDGAMADWAEVLLDGPQTVADRSLAQGDPDAPAQSQRDLRGVAVTWSDTDLFLLASRTGAGTNSFNAIFYVDVGHDGLLDAADRIVFFRFTGSTFNGYDVFAYDDGGSPDPLLGDGITPPGTQGASLATAGGQGAAEATGIRFELSMPWAHLGVPPGTPLLIHPSLSANQNLPSGVMDNADPLDTHLTGVQLTGGGERATGAGGEAFFPHRVTNRGTASDMFDLSPRAQRGFPVALLTDPDGDGDPSDGVLLAEDVNGDGDFTDLVDTPPSAGADANSNGVPDGGALLPDASLSVVLRVRVPVTQQDGDDEVVLLTATSDYRPSDRAQVTDTVRVARLAVVPGRSALVLAGTTTWLAHSACNGSGADLAVELQASAPLGWTTSFSSDPNGDGDPDDGGPLPDADADGAPELGAVPAGTCTPFVVLVDVPAGVPAGTVEAVDVTATGGALVAAAGDTIEVAATPVVVRPDRSRRSQRGRTLYLAHEVVNASGGPELVDLGITSTLGSTVDVVDDPDGDGLPEDSSVVTQVGPLGPHGAAASLLARIRVPATAAHGDVDSVTTEALAAGAGGSDQAVDRIDVVGLLTYSDPFFAHPSAEFFGQCATIHALAFQDAGTFVFEWVDPAGNVVRTSAELSPYSDGSLDDFLPLGATPLQGTWTVRLLRRVGSVFEPVGPEGTATFEVLDLVGGGARISFLDTGADIYELTGDDFVAFAEVDNPTTADIHDSLLEYVVFVDADGDGAPTAGEDVLLADGSFGAWAPGTITGGRAGVDVFAGERFADRLDVASATFSRTGPWWVQLRWTASCGFLLATEAAPFTVGCQPPPTFAGLVDAADVDPCAADGIRLIWDAATSWGVGTSGTYAVYRSTDAGFVPGPDTLLVAGLTATTHVDLTAALDVPYHYIVWAESDVTCSSGPNNDGLVDGNLVRANAADLDAGVIPVADFVNEAPACWSATDGAIDFMDVSLGPPTWWSWDFDGDGVEDSDQPAASFVYPAPGRYDVTLTVGNPCGSDTVVRSVEVTEVPLASVAVDRLETCVGSAVDFDGSLSAAAPPATIAFFAWDFDGDTVVDSTEADPPPRAFGAEGPTEVSLVVTDDLGCSDEARVTITVHPELQVALVGETVDPCTGDASVTAVPTGGLPPYEVAWDFMTDDGAGTGSARLPFDSSTVVTATVTDAAGCVVQAASRALEVPPELVASTEASVQYQYPDDFLATLTGTASGGTPDLSFAWDIDDDGTIDGTGGALAFDMGANESRVVRLTVTDANGCVASVLQQVESGGCPVTDPLRRLMVTRGPGGFSLELTWEPSEHACHGRYQVMEAETPRPAVGAGTFPDDPAWTVIQPEDVDGSDLNEAFSLAGIRLGRAAFFLVRDGGTDGTFAPTYHHGNDQVSP